MGDTKFTGISEGERQKFAAQFGLSETASWDDIYEAWKASWTFWPRNAAKTFIISGIAAAIPVLLFSHWAAAIVSFVLFAGLFFVQYLLFNFAKEDEYYGLLHSNGGDQILSRAKRDGVYY